MRIEFYKLNGDHENVNRRCAFCDGKLLEGDLIMLMDNDSEGMHKQCILQKVLSEEEMEKIDGRA